MVVATPSPPPPPPFPPPPPPKETVIPPPPPPGRPPPPPPEKLEKSRAEKSWRLILLPEPIMENCSSLLILLKFPLKSNRSGTPPPPVNFPKLDWFLSFLTFKLMAVSSLPSSIPVNMD